MFHLTIRSSYYWTRTRKKGLISDQVLNFSVFPVYHLNLHTMPINDEAINPTEYSERNKEIMDKTGVNFKQFGATVHVEPTPSWIPFHQVSVVLNYSQFFTSKCGMVDP